MVTDLSNHAIEITSKFSGTELLIFGAIERYIPQGDGGHGILMEGLDYDIIVVVQSGRRDMVVRRKEHVGPIWVNKESRTLRDMQEFYALTSTKPLGLLLPEYKRHEMGLGLEQLKMVFKEAMTPEEKEEFRSGFIRNMENKKLYAQQEGKVILKDGILFRATLGFPANMPVGNYQVDVYLVRDHRVIVSSSSPLEVEKAGLERIIYVFAHEYSPLYGIVAILIALFSGWLGGYLSIKMSR